MWEFQICGHWIGLLNNVEWYLIGVLYNPFVVAVCLANGLAYVQHSIAPIFCLHLAPMVESWIFIILLSNCVDSHRLDPQQGRR